MNDVELWKRLDAMHETFKSIARSLERLVPPPIINVEVKRDPSKDKL